MTWKLGLPKRFQRILVNSIVLKVEWVSGQDNRNYFRVYGTERFRVRSGEVAFNCPDRMQHRVTKVRGLSSMMGRSRRITRGPIGPLFFFIL